MIRILSRSFLVLMLVVVVAPIGGAALLRSASKIAL